MTTTENITTTKNDRVGGHDVVRDGQKIGRVRNTGGNHMWVAYVDGVAVPRRSRRVTHNPTKAEAIETVVIIHDRYVR